MKRKLGNEFEHMLHASDSSDDTSVLAAPHRSRRRIMIRFIAPIGTYPACPMAPRYTRIGKFTALAFGLFGGALLAPSSASALTVGEFKEVCGARGGIVVEILNSNGGGAVTEIRCVVRNSSTTVCELKWIDAGAERSAPCQAVHVANDRAGVSGAPLAPALRVPGR